MTDTKTALMGILLAAGAGRRFGSGANAIGGKLLHELDGVAIGVRSARNMLAAGLPVTAVVRPGSERLAQLLRAEGVTVTVCANAAQGMGVSLAHAIAATRDAQGWVVALGDMPRIEPATIARIAEALRNGARIAAPRFKGERGLPVGFSAAFGGELVALKGDEGARSLIKRHHAEVDWIEVEDAGVVFDIDRQEDIPASL
ncbi:MAG: nucleotidyltransferase family protein [Betaproteobacteria bacterium]|nr:nucleotidyltransferase family protein [Betaproteobacteria bacterium]